MERGVRFTVWHQNWLLSRSGKERLGESFVNDFIEEPYPELSECEDHHESYSLIMKFLIEEKIFPCVPKEPKK